jgi:hypothetical protein
VEQQSDNRRFSAACGGLVEWSLSILIGGAGVGAPFEQQTDKRRFRAVGGAVQCRSSSVVGIVDSRTGVEPPRRYLPRTLHDTDGGRAVRRDGCVSRSGTATSGDELSPFTAAREGPHERASRPPRSI